MDLIILDRDGTLIPDEFYKNCNRENWHHIMPINHKLIKLIKRNFKDYICFIVTNQAPVALGLYTESRVKEINNFLITYLKNECINVIDHNYCPHVDINWATDTGTPVNVNYVRDFTNRKPSPTMVYQLLKKHNYTIKAFDKIYVFGDRHEDKELAINLSAKYIAMDFDTPYSELENKIK